MAAQGQSTSGPGARLGEVLDGVHGGQVAKEEACHYWLQ